MTETARKVFIRTFGCQMNEYDSDKMADVLAAAEGFEKTENVGRGRPHPLQHLLGAREGAGEGVRRPRAPEAPQAREARPPDRRGRVRGEPGGRGDRAPRARSWTWSSARRRCTAFRSCWRGRRATGRAQVDISFPEIEKFDHLPPARVEGASAFVSIMEGCSKYCSFCVVPYTRGEEVSRPFDDVLAEVRDLAGQGREGDHAPRPERERLSWARWPTASRRTSRSSSRTWLAIEGIERLRYTTSHPLEFSQRLIDAYAKIPKLVSQVHLPVQSGSDRMLAAMKRNYTAMEYKSIIRRLRAVRPDISISSDFIVGFPGETEADFEQTMKLVEDVRFDGSFSFVYSPRPGTPAANLRRRHAARGEARAPAAAAEAPAGALRGVLARHGRHPPARAGRGAVEEGRGGAGRADGQQPGRELSRAMRVS